MLNGVVVVEVVFAWPGCRFPRRPGAGDPRLPADPGDGPRHLGPRGRRPAPRRLLYPLLDPRVRLGRRVQHEHGNPSRPRGQRGHRCAPGPGGDDGRPARTAPRRSPVWSARLLVVVRSSSPNLLRCRTRTRRTSATASCHPERGHLLGTDQLGRTAVPRAARRPGVPRRRCSRGRRLGAIGLVLGAAAGFSTAAGSTSSSPGCWRRRCPAVLLMLLLSWRCSGSRSPSSPW